MIPKAPSMPTALAPLRSDDSALKGSRLSASSLWDDKPVVSKLPSAVSRVQQMAMDAMAECEVCGDGDDEVGNDLLLCEASGCGRAYHLQCLHPPLGAVPKRRWLCPDCVVASSAEAAETAEWPPSASMDDMPSMDDDSLLGATPMPGITSSSTASLSAAAVDGASRAFEPPTPATSAREWCARRRALLRQARAALHLASMPTALLCREEQLRTVYQFCQERLAARQGGAMYVSGSPGLGKSLTIRQAHDHIAASLAPEHRVALVNAFHIASPSAVYATLLSELGVEVCISRAACRLSRGCHGICPACSELTASLCHCA